MKIIQSTSLNLIFNLLLALLLIELVQSVIKYFSPYYFNVFRMGVFATIVLLLGLKIGAKKGLLLPVYLVAMFLIILQYFIVWN